MKLYRTTSGCVVEQDEKFYSVGSVTWDVVVAREDLGHYLRKLLDAGLRPARNPFDDTTSLKAPIGSQEVWAAGVTYYRSRDARMEESKSAGGGDFYDRVYRADRPDCFLRLARTGWSGISNRSRFAGTLPGRYPNRSSRCW